MSRAVTLTPAELRSAPPGLPLTEEQRRVLSDVEEHLASGAGIDEVLDRMVEGLQAAFHHHAWTGVYLVDGEHLVLGPFRGPESPHHRIRIGEEGICGWVAGHRAPQVIPDVNADSRYLMCSATIRSEIVVPIVHEDRILGVIDVDSEIPAAFTATDLDALTELAAAVAPALARHRSPLVRT